MSNEDEQKMSDEDDDVESIYGNEKKKSGNKRGPSAGTKYNEVKKCALKMIRK
jgi:hypothetical protein